MGTNLLNQSLLRSDITGIHIEPTNICTLKCPGCARTRVIKQWPQHWKNHSINIADVVKFLDIDLKNKKIILCGNYGDPIYHPNLFDLINQLKQRGCFVSIVTNGSYKTAEWWHKLVTVLDSTDTVTFSVDGLPANFTNYRINADWTSIQQAMQICVKSAARTVWKFIPFAYNINDINSVKQLSESMGIDLFQLEKSDRFDEITAEFKPAAEFIQVRYQAQQDWKLNKSQTVLTPRCADGREHFISADGYYMPCCFIGDHRFYYKTQFGKNKRQYKISDTTLSQILDQSATIEFYNNLTQQPVCQYSCPKTL